MEKPTMFKNFAAAPDIEVLPSFFPIPGLGIVPVNAFLIRAAEPVLVDTGVAPLSDEFMAQLVKIINPEDLRWLWLTHTDQDHIGSLQPILDAAPRLRVITTYLGVGKMSLFRPLPLDRVYLLNPGQELGVGERTLKAVRPPTYDAPETTGLYDLKSGAFFSADSFGALMSEPAFNAADIEPETLKNGLVTWAKLDSPWLHSTDRRSFADTLESIRKMAPKVILSCHLPPAYGLTDRLLDYMSAAPAGDPFVGPDQRQLEAMLGGGGKE